MTTIFTLIANIYVTFITVTQSHFFILVFANTPNNYKNNYKHVSLFYLQMKIHYKLVYKKAFMTYAIKKKKKKQHY